MYACIGSVSAICERKDVKKNEFIVKSGYGRKNKVIIR